MRPPGRRRHGRSRPAAHVSSASSSLLFARRFRGGDAAVMARGASFDVTHEPSSVICGTYEPTIHDVLSSAQHNHSHHNLAHHPLVTHLCPGRCILQPQAPQPRGVHNPRVKRGLRPRRLAKGLGVSAAERGRQRLDQLGHHLALERLDLVRGCEERSQHMTAASAHRAARGGCRRAGRNCHSRSSRCACQTDERRHRAHRCSRRREARG